MQKTKPSPGPRALSKVGDRDLTGSQTPLRFAVTTFDTCDALRAALLKLSADGLGTDGHSCLGLLRVLGRAMNGPLQAGPVSGALQELPFPDSGQEICCTKGRVATILLDRLHAGARTLEAALSRWLIPRHAAQLQDAVEAGRIVLWVQLFDSEGERRVCHSLLSTSSASVGVHDLAAR